MDIGSALGRAAGSLTDEQVRALDEFETSPAFTEDDRVVLRYVDAMSGAQVDVPDALFEALRARFDAAQLVELTATIAWENYRARFNRALGVEADGFSEGAVCALPTRPRSG